MGRNRKANRKTRGPARPAQQGFHIMAKPAGPSCNLRCQYCFYREKSKLFHEGTVFHMPDEVLDAFTRKYIASQPGHSVTFEWQGGEPGLLGVDFFQRALDFQNKHNLGKQITNSFQTNGTIIDDDWCAFLANNRFLVGLSLDGPEDVHDACRVDASGGPTFARVLHSLRLMQNHGVQVNVLAAVNRESLQKPLEVYRFFRQQGVRFIQFIPVVEREADREAEKLGLNLALPPDPTREEEPAAVTSWSVDPGLYGHFLSRIFDEWVRNDVGKIFVMNFEWTLAAWAGVGPGVCYLAPRCGRNLVMEFNGDVFSCDHFVYPGYRLGNILEGEPEKMVRSKKQAAFGASKETALPGYCRRCDFLFACRGGCPKHRFAKSPDGDPGLNYLCKGFREFYQHVDPVMRCMVDLIGRGIPVSRIMALFPQGSDSEPVFRSGAF